MRANQAVHRSEAMTQSIPKVAAAFVTGLVTVFGGALIYSNLQNGDLVQAVQPARLEHPASSEKLPTPAVAPAQSSPENSTGVEDQKQETTSSVTAVSPELSARNTSVLARPAEDRLSTRSHALDEHGRRLVPQPAPVQKPVVTSTGSILSGALPPGSAALPQFVPNSNIAPQPQLSALIQKNKDTSGPEHRNPDVEQPVQASVAPSQTAHPEPILSASASKVVVVPASTTLEVRLLETLSSDRNRPGDTFRATLITPLVANGYLLADTGATVLGRVETARKAPLIGKQSELSVTLTEIDTLDGQRTRVATGWRKVKGVRSTLTNTTKMAVGAVTGTAKGAEMANSALDEGHAGSGLRAESRTAVLPAEAQLTFILIAPLTATGTQQR